MVRVVLALLFAALPQFLQAQSWETLPVPTSLRFNDVYFVSPDTGWVVNGSAFIYKTVDGGNSWSEQFYQRDSHLRSVGFLNAHRGFAGNVGPGEFGATDPASLYETSDGGETWSPMGVFQGQAPEGLCGMNVVNDTTVVAVGRVRGPAFFVRTDNAGETWTSKNMSEYAQGLIDVYFPHPDTGFSVGLTHEDHEQSRGVVLATTDGGETWEQRFVTSRTGEWFWKMSFPTRRTGYASLQRNGGGSIHFAKTTDGGLTWEEKYFREDYFVQGIGFVDENTGWIGGNSTQPAYLTKDGGETWSPMEIGIRLNRFRFLSDTLGYAAGGTVHRFTSSPSTGIASEVTPTFSTDPIHPNPFSDAATLSYSLDAPSTVSAAVFDALGRSVRTLHSGLQTRGTHDLFWDGHDDGGQSVAPGVYFLVLRIGEHVQTRPVVYVR